MHENLIKFSCIFSCLKFILFYSFVRVNSLVDIFFVLSAYLVLVLAVLFLLWFLIKLGNLLDNSKANTYPNVKCLQAEILIILGGTFVILVAISAVSIIIGYEPRPRNTIWGPRGCPQWRVFFEGTFPMYHTPQYYLIFRPSTCVSPLAVTNSLPTNLTPTEFLFYMQGKQGILACCKGV